MYDAPQQMKIERFLWHPRKAEENEKKHGVSFKEGIECFYGAPFVARSFRKGERPYRLLGQSYSGRYLTVIFALLPGGEARLISGRDMTEGGRKLHRRKRGE